MRSATGDGNAAAGLGSYYHVFNNPLYRLATPNSNSGNDVFEHRMLVDAEMTPPPWARSQPLLVDVDITGPSFTTRVRAQQLLSTTALNTPWGPTTRYLVRGEGVPPGGEMDPTDNGRYTYRVVVRVQGVERGGFDAASFWLWWGEPNPGGPPGTTGVSLISSDFSDTRWQVTVRYAGPSGVNLSTLGGDDLEMRIHKPEGFFVRPGRFYQNTTRPFALVSYLAYSDGSVQATYQATPIAQAGWSRYEMGEVSVRFDAGAVQTNAGTSWGDQVFAQSQLNSNIPTLINPSIWSAVGGSLEFHYRLLAMDNEGWNIPAVEMEPAHNFMDRWMRAVGTRTEIIGPSGQVYTPVATYIGHAPFVEQPIWRGWNMRMVISPPGGAPRGEYRVYVVDGAVRQWPGGYFPRTLVGRVVY